MVCEWFHVTDKLSSILTNSPLRPGAICHVISIQRLFFASSSFLGEFLTIISCRISLVVGIYTACAKLYYILEMVEQKTKEKKKLSAWNTRTWETIVERPQVIYADPLSSRWRETCERQRKKGEREKNGFREKKRRTVPGVLLDQPNEFPMAGKHTFFRKLSRYSR